MTSSTGPTGTQLAELTSLHCLELAEYVLVHTGRGATLVVQSPIQPVHLDGHNVGRPHGIPSVTRSLRPGKGGCADYLAMSTVNSRVLRLEPRSNWRHQTHVCFLGSLSSTPDTSIPCFSDLSMHRFS